MGRLRIGGDGDAITTDLQRTVVQTEDTGLAVVRDLVISKLGGVRWNGWRMQKMEMAHRRHRRASKGFGELGRAQ